MAIEKIAIENKDHNRYQRNNNMKFWQIFRTQNTRIICLLFEQSVKKITIITYLRGRYGDGLLHFIKIIFFIFCNKWYN